MSGVRIGKWRRVPAPEIMRAQYPGTRCYQTEVSDGHLSVFVGREPVQQPNEDRRILWHLSISHRINDHPHNPGRYPTWDEIRDARYAFIPDEITMAMLLPPRAEYLNVHATTFHLWEVSP